MQHDILSGVFELMTEFVVGGGNVVLVGGVEEFDDVLFTVAGGGLGV